jgi:hypothetical protein
VAAFGLGAHLIDQGVLDRDQLAQALEAQVVCGGRLGTNLVELGLLDLDQLSDHLSAMTGVAVPPKDWLESPAPNALALLPKEVLEQRGALPLRADPAKLHLAMLDPTNQALLDELARIAGRTVIPYVLPELRLRFALERHAGIVRPVRLANVAKKLEGVRRRASAQPDERPEEVRLREALGISALGQGEDLIDESDFAELHQRLVAAREHAAGGPAPRAQAELAQGDVVATMLPDDPIALEAALADALDRDSAARAALALARRHVEAAALLVVHRGMVIGLLGSGGELERHIEAVLVPLDAESAFAHAAARNEPYRGAPPATPLDGRVLRALGRASAREIALLPIPVRGRVVNLLYVDGGDGPLAETALGALSALTVCIARSYERIILSRKQV